MKGLIMDYPLTVPAIARRAEALFATKEVVSRLPDRSLHRYTYGDLGRRVRQLAVALAGLGVRPGDRVATLCWNHYRHLETYFGVPALGAIIHTLNPRLSADDLAYIASDAEDRVIVVDEALLPVLESFRERTSLEHVVVVGDAAKGPGGALGYEVLLAGADPSDFEEAALDERDAAAMCYTSGTTGKSKGVVYSHRAIALHSLVSATVDAIALGEADVVMPVVPMFHANGWGLPFTATLVGAAQVLPGPHLDPASLLQLLEGERVTLTAGVPTVWLGVLQALDREPDAHDLSSLRTMVVGGSAAPRSMIEAFGDRHGLYVLHAWGMTEMSPLGTVARVAGDLEDGPDDVRYAYRAKQGRPIPFVEIRARGDQGLVPADGETMGELEVRGPCIASAYYKAESTDQFTEDGWFRTGDIVTIDPRGYIEITDRAKDLIKSGGEWISSVALENALMGHPAVAEAAVIGVPHPKWQERPLAVVVLKEGASATAEALRAHLEPHFPRWSLPDGFEFVDEIPRTAAGKFRKTALRERFRDRAPSTP